MKPIHFDRHVVERVTTRMRGLLRGGWGPVYPRAPNYPVTVIYPLDITVHPPSDSLKLSPHDPKGKDQPHDRS